MIYLSYAFVQYCFFHEDYSMKGMAYNLGKAFCMIRPNYDYFLRIVECGNISKAAESLFISQPSLTKYLQRLEAELGIELFERKQQPLKLTYAGTCFYDYVKQVSEQEKTLRDKISEIKNEGRAQIAIGMALWRANVLLPEFLPGFMQRHPLIQVKLKEGSAVTLENAIMNEEIDFGIMNLPVTYANVYYEPIIQEHIFMVGSRQSPLVQRLTACRFDAPPHHADIHVFAAQPFILTQPGQHITNYVNSMLSRNNVELNCIFRTANVSTAVNLAAANVGFTFVPEIGTHSSYFPMEKVALFTVDSPPLTCTFAAVYKKTRYLSDASQIFIRELKSFCDGLNRWY